MLIFSLTRNSSIINHNGKYELAYKGIFYEWLEYDLFIFLRLVLYLPYSSLLIALNAKNPFSERYVEGNVSMTHTKALSPL